MRTPGDRTRDYGSSPASSWLFVFARVVVSWLLAFGMRPPVTGPARTGYDLLFDVTEPVLRPLRRIVPPAGPVDVTVLVAFVIIIVLHFVICP